MTLAGAGPLEGELRAQAEALGVAEAVDLPGFVEPWETMAEHDVLVQLSAWENLSYTLLDAAAAGLPAVATDVGGNGEILPPSAWPTRPLRRPSLTPSCVPRPTARARCAWTM